MRVDFSVSIRIGTPRQPAVVQEPAERLEAETALADVLVPVNAGAARFFGIIAVQHLQPIEADKTIERGQRLGVTGVGHDVIA